MSSSSSTISERVQLVKLCSSRDWSKAIRVLDSLLAHPSSSIQDICNRAYCYSQLELHKHVIKDCDRALQLDPRVLQAYILKGHALSSLGRKEDAVLVWEQGYEHAIHQSSDLKQLLELEELLKSSKQTGNVSVENNMSELSSTSAPEFGLAMNGNVSKISDIHKIDSCTKSAVVSEINKSGDNFETHNGIHEVGDESPVPLLSPCTSVTSSENCENRKLINRSNACNGLKGATENTSKLRNESDIYGRLADKAGGNKKPDGQLNGNHDTLGRSGYDVASSNGSNVASKLSSKYAVLQSDPGNTVEIHMKSTKNSDTHSETSDEVKRNKKFSVTRLGKTKSISVDFRLSRGIAHVNEGKYASAISVFDQILKEDPTYPEALIGRGTAFAFKRELEAAIADFSKAIHYNPSAGEAWKRRGQARAALGESVEAIEDLTKALELEPNSADILHEKGIVNFKFKDFSAAVKDLSKCVNLDKDNKSAYTYLGLALSSIGEYKMAEEAHSKAIQLDQNFLEAWVHLTQYYQELPNSTKALECIHQILLIDKRFAKAYHLRGLLLHGLGEHREAIKELSAGLSIDNLNIDCLYLRASSYHAVGEYSQAVKDYDATLDIELDSMEKFMLQCMAFYQKEIALYTASKVNSEFFWFDVDGDMDPLFKEYWCKRLHPKNVCEKVYRQTPLADSLKRGKLRKQDFIMTKHKKNLLMAADLIGQKLQYHCPGFLPNKRQHRMAGLAAIEIAQRVSKAWRSLQAEKKSNKNMSKNGKRPRRRTIISSQNRGGAGCSTSSSLELSTSHSSTDDRASTCSMMSWQEVYTLAVRWRQISEPCDPVVWVNKLSEEFNTGFGSHTPITVGQAKVARYYPNYERTLTVAKTVVRDKLFVYSKNDQMIDLSKDEKLQDVMNAKTCSDLYRAIGEDFWLATWCNSTAFEGKRLEGTRITLVKTGHHGFDFAIRTPCTPSRWDEFDVEMAMAWEAVCNAYCGEAYGSTNFDLLEDVRDAILRMTYYWYNFMPLSRGTAAVGFIVLLGLLLAGNMEFTGEIPKGVQVDWEAILNSDPSSFVDSIKGWMYPSLKIKTSWKDYPDVASTLDTTGSVVAALSSYDDSTPSSPDNQGKQHS